MRNGIVSIDDECGSVVDPARAEQDSERQARDDFLLARRHIQDGHIIVSSAPKQRRRSWCRSAPTRLCLNRYADRAPIGTEKRQISVRDTLLPEDEALLHIDQTNATGIVRGDNPRARAHGLLDPVAAEEAVNEFLAGTAVRRHHPRLLEAVAYRCERDRAPVR